MATWIPAYVGLGSNLDDPLGQVSTAAAGLGQLEETRLVRQSPWYRNPPMGPADQPDYVNGVVGLLTQLTARRLLEALESLEEAQGRRRKGERWGPRSIDLDLLLYGERQIDEPGLKIPHPGITRRPFVIGPLADISQDVLIPGLGRVRKFVKVCDLSSLTRIEIQSS